MPTLQEQFQTLLTTVQSGRGNIKTYYLLARCYEFGFGTPKNKQAADERYQQAFANNGLQQAIQLAKSGDVEAIFILACVCFYGHGGVAENEVAAEKYFLLAANQGHTEAQFMLGGMYEDGLGGLPKSDEKAVELYQQAATQGDARAQCNLGLKYEQGRGGLSKSDEKAVELYQQAAAQGNATAQCRLGVMYKDGRGGLAKNDEKAIELWQQAAAQGNAIAQCNLGVMYEQGLGGLPKSDEKAVELYQQAAKHGNAAAQCNLGVMYEHGRGGLPKSDEKAVEFYQQAAEQGNAAAQCNLSLMYENGQGGLPKSDEKVVGLYQQAAAQEDANAQFMLGVMYEQGRGGLPKSDEKAVELYQLAAAQGNAAAQCNLGLMYENGRGGLPKSDKKAVELYQQAAAQGNAIAQCNLGVMYEQGRGGLPKSDEKAVELYQQAVAQGKAAAQYNLGVMYEQGHGGLPKSDEKAVELYQQAAAQGKAAAQYNLGVMYEQGHGGLPKSDEKAVELYQQAAEQGLTAAQCSLGWMYEQGRGGLPKSDEKAVELYQQAAAQGLARAQCNLGVMYEQGRGGLPKSIEQAAYWYRLAAAQQYGRAKAKQLSLTHQQVLNTFLQNQQYDQAQAYVKTLPETEQTNDYVLKTWLICLIAKDASVLPYECIPYSQDLSRLLQKPDIALTLFQQALKQNHLQALDLLLDLGCDIESGDETGNTPFLQAAAEHNVEAMQFLYEHGADITATNTAGENAVYVLLNNSQTESRVLSDEISAQIQQGLSYLWECGASFYLPIKASDAADVLPFNTLAFYAEFVKEKLVALAESDDTEGLEKALKRCVGKTNTHLPKPDELMLYKSPWLTAFSTALAKKHYAACALILKYSKHSLVKNVASELKKLCDVKQLREIQSVQEKLLRKTTSTLAETPNLLLRATAYQVILTEEEQVALHAFAKHTYETLCACAALQPMLVIAGLAVLGRHNLAMLGWLQSHGEKELKIYLDPHSQQTDSIKVDSDPSLGLYSNKNAVYIGALNYDNQPDKVQSTIGHELMHFAVKEVYENWCKPYLKDDEETKQKVDALCQRLKDKRQGVPQVIKEMYSLYESDKWPSELMARTGEYVLTFKTAKEAEIALRKVDVELARFYFDTILPQMQKHAAELQQRWKVSTDVKKQQLEAIAGQLKQEIQEVKQQVPPPAPPPLPTRLPVKKATPLPPVTPIMEVIEEEVIDVIEEELIVEEVLEEELIAAETPIPWNSNYRVPGYTPSAPPANEAPLTAGTMGLYPVLPEFNPETMIPLPPAMFSYVPGHTSSAPSATNSLLASVNQFNPSSQLVSAVTQSVTANLVIEYGQIKKGTRIARGGYGEVYQGKFDGSAVAIKELYFNEIEEERITRKFHEEAQTLHRLSHPRIVRLFGITKEPHALVMEYMPLGSLDKVLRQQKLSYQQKLRIALDIALGLKYLHEKGITHRDLKSLNVLLEEKEGQYRAKIADFGLAESKQISRLRSQLSSRPKGSTLWLAPELCVRGARTNTASDIYSLGVVLWELMSERFPFEGEEQLEMVPMWVQQGTREEIPANTPADFAALIQQCWDGNAANRPTAAQVVEQLTTMFKATKQKTATTAIQPGSATTKPVNYGNTAGRVFQPPRIDNGSSSSQVGATASNSSRPPYRTKTKAAGMQQGTKKVPNLFVPGRSADEEALTEVNAIFGVPTSGVSGVRPRQ
jgi:TPR repeat protein/serine/threonine protein kinase